MQTSIKLLEPVRLQFNEFKEKVDKYYTEDVKWRGVLDHELKQLTAANLGLNEQAENLARALKGDSKFQGDWGGVSTRTNLRKRRSY